MKLFYIKNSVKEFGDDFTVDLMDKAELKKEIETLDDGDFFIEYKYGKGNVDGWWCIQIGEGMFETSESCGRECVYYDPRNGKNGMCKNLRPSVIETGKTFKKGDL